MPISDTKFVREFREWLIRSGEGEEFIYHTGHLARDRVHSIIADHIALDAQRAERLGLVLLFQKRIGATPMPHHKPRKGCFYIARRTLAPIPAKGE